MLKSRTLFGLTVYKSYAVYKSHMGKYYYPVVNGVPIMNSKKKRARDAQEVSVTLLIRAKARKIRFKKIDYKKAVHSRLTSLREIKRNAETTQKND